ncbi:hypothetical protein WG68_07105 [Arsukibacterium ikkense]|uniref:DUF1840 domain-containing protein n=1 Tax=Arsukibacterium ikkense TaxID=336831 RepID=A0A0M2V5K8_9GAMM|nr:DUF1840 domain-containing protein [Arsukibacterium ikkense]KKO46117.1 hypothetical protein WG68_07105 [Arsukibacterium ikkense]
MITFKSQAGGDVSYHKNVALDLLSMLGRDQKVPSAMYADDVAAAINRLQQQLAKLAAEQAEAGQEREAGEPDTAEEEDDTTKVSLSQRAQPLLKLLQQAQAANTGIMWE